MKKLTLIIIVTIAFIQSSRAGFPIGYGRYLLIPGYNYYTASGYWGPTSNYNSYGSGNFSSHYFNLYGGYGISRRLNFLYNLPIVNQVDNNTSGKNKLYSAFALGDASLGLSYFFNDFDDLTHVCLTGSLIVPLYQNQGTPYPNIGYQSLGAEAKLGFSGSATGGFRNPYYDIEFGMRQYFASDGPFQVFANVTGGIPVSDDWKISGTISGVNSISSAITSSTTQVFYNYNKSFYYLRLAANAGYVVNENLSIWGGLYTDVAGRSVGKGSGLSLSAVIKF